MSLYLLIPLYSSCGKHFHMTFSLAVILKNYFHRTATFQTDPSCESSTVVLREQAFVRKVFFQRKPGNGGPVVLVGQAYQEAFLLGVSTLLRKINM